MDAIHIVGAGGIGSAVGYALAKAGHSVTFVERSAEKIDWGQKHGVGVERLGASPAAFVPFDDWMPTAHSIVLLCTKCYDNPTILSRVPENALLVPIQNGFDPALNARPPRVEGIASFVSECPPGRTHTRITRAGRLHLGINGPAESRLGQLADRLARLLSKSAPFRVTLTDNILPIKHTKLMYNAALCPLAAAGGLDNGDVLLRPRVRELFFALLRENHSILRRAEIELGQVGPLPTPVVAGVLSRPWLARPLAWVFARTLRGTYCSMSGDLPMGQTEVENYNGHLIHLAGDTPCPLNRLALALVRRMTAERLPPSGERLDEVWHEFRARAQFEASDSSLERIAG